MDLKSNILQSRMKFPNLRPPCCMPSTKMMRNLWNLKERLQYILARRLLEKKMMTINEEEEPKCDEYIVGPYLRQMVENL